MPAGRLTYEQMLGELLALLGERVFVTVRVEIAGGVPLLATLSGVLDSGRDTGVASSLEEAVHAGGESVIFTVAAPEPPTAASFVVTESTYRLGRREPDGGLSFRAGKARVEVVRESAD